MPKVALIGAGMAEYLPFYIPYPEMIEQLHIPIGEYIRRCEEQEREFDQTRRIAGGEVPLPDHYRTLEYAAPIINAMESNQPALIYGNVENRGLINNLPQDCCVEAPCLVDGNGIQPVYTGELPPSAGLWSARGCSPGSVQQCQSRRKLDTVDASCRVGP